MPRAVLIGPPGSGKSSVGKALARELSSTFLDTDHLIESVAGKKIAEIFAERGESGFREIEEEVVLGVLASEPGVVALGGGSILSSAVRERLATVKLPVIYLTISAKQAVARIADAHSRPLLTVDPMGSWQKIADQRADIYQSLATLTYSTDSKKPAEIAHRIALELSGASH